MKKIVYGLMALSPALTLAATPVGTIGDTAESLANTFKRIINILIPAFFGLAIVYFFWGMAKYISSAGDPEKASEGKSIMIYGVIGIAVMASLYGLVAFLTASFGIGANGAVTLPTV